VKNTFKVGDIVTVINVLGECDMRVVEVWCNSEPFYLLLTDVEGLTLKTNPIPARDCILKHRPENIPVKEYRRKHISYLGSLIKTDLYK
jgi:hypothetical protein